MRSSLLKKFQKYRIYYLAKEISRSWSFWWSNEQSASEYADEVAAAAAWNNRRWFESTPQLSRRWLSPSRHSRKMASTFPVIPNAETKKCVHKYGNTLQHFSVKNYGMAQIMTFLFTELTDPFWMAESSGIARYWREYRCRDSFT